MNFINIMIGFCIGFLVGETVWWPEHELMWSVVAVGLFLTNLRINLKCA
jgi:hypothetical protein